MNVLSTKRDRVMQRTWDIINNDQKIELAIETRML